MKLIFCPECQDVVVLSAELKACKCRAAWGRLNGDVIEINSHAIPIGIRLGEFWNATQGSLYNATHKYVANYGDIMTPIAAWGYRMDDPNVMVIGRDSNVS